MIVSLVEEAMAGGAREERACEVIGIEPRTLQRWRRQSIGEDRRQGPNTMPKNALSPEEKAEVLAVASTPEHRDLSPKQIVPKLADEGVYLASESSFYRVLRAAEQMSHRGRAKAPTVRHVPVHVASGPNQVWVWDITYLPTAIRGVFNYMYMIMDLFSRKVVGFAVYEVESMVLSAALLQASVETEGVDAKTLVLHADNGGPMKGSTMLAKMQQLGVLPSFSRPNVSDDNAFPEAFFRHLKYAPTWPKKPFGSLEEARTWVSTFVTWYNTAHRHSGIQFLRPADRHAGKDAVILAARKTVYEQAKERHPERWTGATRDCTPVSEVGLTPGGTATTKARRAKAAERASKAGAGSSCRRRRSPIARTPSPHRAEGGSRTAKPASGASESLRHPSTVGVSTSRRRTSSRQGLVRGPNGAVK